MNIYDNLGRNLRELCEQRGSISEVCRDLNVNRQQFTKYLSGENFPRRQMLDKICSYFGVRDIDLLRDPDSVVVEQDRTVARLDKSKSLKRLFGNFTDKQDMPLEDGIYYTYFQAHQQTNWIIRSVTVVREEAGLKTFRRLTGVRETKRSAWRLYRGKHSGVVLNRRRYLYFVGADSSSTKATSLVVAEWGSMEVDVLKGLALIWTTDGPDFCNCLLEKVPAGTGLWEAMRESGTIGLKEDRLPGHIQRIFHNFSLL